MTNIMATIIVCIVTNVTPSVEREVIGTRPTPCPDADYGKGVGFGGVISCLVYHCENIYGDEIAKTETTEVVEIKTLRLTWEGEEYTAKRERVLSSKVRRWKKRDDWVEDEPSM
jgi:hypothetical protein